MFHHYICNITYQYSICNADVHGGVFLLSSCYYICLEVCGQGGACCEGCYPSQQHNLVYARFYMPDVPHVYLNASYCHGSKSCFDQSCSIHLAY